MVLVGTSGWFGAKIVLLARDSTPAQLAAFFPPAARRRDYCADLKIVANKILWRP